jgi:2-methylcitrate dehydratase PrpD
MRMASAAERLARFASSLSYEDLPGEVVEAAKLHLLDTLGCGLAADALGVATHARSALAEPGGDGDASVIGLPHGLRAADAAFANATLCHGLDFDDTHSDSICHVSVVVCPAAVASAESAAASGRELLAAIVAGNEIVTRLGMAASGEFHRRGFHPTAVCGIFGAAAAAGRLAGLDERRIANALGIAGSMASGLFAYLEDGSATKPIHPGWAAHGAIVASRLAEHGATGPASVLEGRFGLFHAYVDRRDVDLETQLADLGERWETLRIAYKPYPACHFMHGSLGATETLVGRVDPDQIEEIVVAIPEDGVSLVLEPAAAKIAPRTEYEAKFSLQYSTAAMLCRGHIGVGDYVGEAIADPRVVALAGKVRYETREYPTYPRAFPGGVRVRLGNGRTLEADLPHQKGAPENPFSREDVVAKFRDNASLALDEDAVESLERAVLELDRRDDVRDVFTALAGERVGA